MREVIIQILTEILPAILGIIATAFIGFLSSKYAKLANTEIKKSVISDTAKFVEQIYMDIHGDDKLNTAKRKAIQILNEKGIKITDNELTVLIESAVKKMNNEDLQKFISEVKNGGAE